ncbi:MAG: hypothetical protein ACTS85_02990 [Arsenophonus sp. NC-PG7-MAG3]
MLALFPKGMHQKLKGELAVALWITESCDADNKSLDVFVTKVIRINIPTAMKKNAI